MVTTTNQDADTYTLAELARKLGISMTVAYELAKDDRLPVPGFKVGREWRFSKDLYQKLMAGEWRRTDKEQA